MAAYSFGNNCSGLKKTWVLIMAVTLFLSAMSSRRVEAARPLGIEPWFMKNHLILQSLPKGSKSTPSPNPCTYIPGTSRGRCTLAENEENVTARSRFHAPPPPPPFPEVMAKENVAVADNDHGSSS